MIVAAVWIYQTDERFVAFILPQNFPDFESKDKAKTLSGQDGLETPKRDFAHQTQQNYKNNLKKVQSGCNFSV